jgi:hypothetical protein
MASILESVTGLLTPGVVGQISKAMGVDASLVQSGLNAVGPTVLGSLAKSAATTDGAASLFKTISGMASGGGGDTIGALLSSITGGGTDADMMQNMLGSGANAITGTLAKSLGFDVGPLMKLGAPVIGGLLSKSVKDMKLDASGLASLLTKEAKAFTDNPANKATSQLVASALKASDTAAALRRTFSDAEWAKVRMAPMAAVYLVTSASPSGFRGTGQELAAAAGAVKAAASDASPTSLVGMAFGGGLTKAELERMSGEAPARPQAVAVIRDGLAAVKAKSAADAAAYRAMILSVATKTAEAAKEGGFLGIGGTQVSAEEQVAITDITAALA